VGGVQLERPQPLAARTNELDAGERRPIMGGGEGAVRCWL